MLAKLYTFSLLGIEAVPEEVEVDVSPATMPKTILVGLPEAAVKESTHRVDRAMVNSGNKRLFDRLIHLPPGFQFVRMLPTPLTCNHHCRAIARGFPCSLSGV